MASAFSNNIEDGLDHIVRIEWDPEVQDLEVWFDCELRLIAGVDIIDDIFNGQSNVWWGFTAATGGSANVQVVCLQENILAVSEDVTICSGSDIQLNAAGNPNGTFEWSPTTGLDDPTSQSPIASPETSTTYTVTYTDFCDVHQSNEVTVNVEELDLSGSVNGIISCYEPTIEIEAENNFSDEVIYTWSTDDGQITSGQGTATITVSEPGIYTVSGNFDNACFDTESFEVEADLEAYTVAIDPQPDIDCLHTTLQLNTSTNGELIIIE